MISHGTFAGTGDEPHYQMIAHSIAFDSDFDLANNYGDPQNIVFNGNLSIDGHAVPDRSGVLRPLHDVGLPLLFAPYFALSYEIAEATVRVLPKAWLERAKLNEFIVLRHLLSLAMSLFAAWIAVQLFSRFATHMPSRRAFFWASLLTLSPPLLSHAFLFFPDIVSAAFSLWAFGWITGERQHGRFRAMLVGVTAGGLFLLHTRNAGLVCGLVALQLYRFWERPLDRRPTMWFAIAVVATVAVRTLLVHYFWGTFLTTPHASFSDVGDIWSICREMVVRVVGWMVDQEHGLLPYAPIYVLVPLGWLTLWRQDRALCLKVSCVVAAYVAPLLLPFVNHAGWRGGWSPAARFLVPVVPFLAVLVFAVVRHRPIIPMWVNGLVAVQLILDAVWWQHPKFLWNDGDGVSAAVIGLFGKGTHVAEYLPSLVEPASSPTIWLGLLFICGWMALSLSVDRASRHRSVR